MSIFSAASILLLASHVAAVRQIDLDTITDSERSLKVSAAEEKAYKDFEQAVEEGARIESELTCEDIASQMPSEITKAREVLGELFQSPNMSEETETRAMQTSEEIMALAAAADGKKCLPAVMNAPSVQTGISGLLAQRLGNVLIAPDSYGTTSMDRAYNRLIAWQQGTLDQAGPDLERTALMPADIEANCPAPCGSCSREHNSWRKGEEMFKFKCLLNHGEASPAQAGLECTPPRRRRSFWRPHKWGRKSWCTVHDWQQQACRQLRVTAMVGCGTDLILQTILHHWNASTVDNFASHTYFDCVKWETTLSPYGSMHYRYGHAGFRHTVPLRNQLGFRLVLALGLANGLAALRDSSSSTKLDPPADFLSIFLQGRPVDSVLRQIFNGDANEGGRQFTDSGEMDLTGDITRSCDLMVQDIDKCRGVWKTRMTNLPIHAWRLTWALGSMVQYAVFFGAITFLTNAAGFAVLGALFSTNLLTNGYVIVFKALIMTAMATIGAFTGWEAWFLKDYGFNPQCDIDGAPRGRRSWTDVLDDLKEHIDKNYNSIHD